MGKLADEYMNMSDMDKVLLLYRMQVDRFSKSEFTENQKRMAGQLLDFYKEFSSVDQAAEAIKASPLQTEMARALVLDQLRAESRAARDTARPDLAQVYQDQYERVEEDYSAAFNIGYTEEVKRLEAAYSDMLHAFNTGLRAYYMAKLEPQFEGAWDQKPLESLKEALTKIHSLGYTLADLAQVDYVKAGFGLDGSIIDEYVEKAEDFADGKIDFKLSDDFQGEINQALDELLPQADEIRELAGTNQEYFPGGYCVFVSPESPEGQHQIILYKQESEDWSLR